MAYKDVKKTNERYPYPKFYNFNELLSSSAKKFPSCSAVNTGNMSDNGKMSFSDFYGRVCCTAQKFREMYYGDNIMLSGENSASWLIAYFAIVLSGNTVIPTDPELSIEEFSSLAIKSDAKLIICDEDIISKGDEEQLAVPRIKLTDFTSEFVYVEGFVPDCDCNRPSVILYTSGTTGNNKMIMLSQKNICSDVYGCLRLVKNRGTTVTVLPYHHTFSMLNVFIALCRGSEIYACRSVQEFFEVLKTHKPTYLYLVPAIIRYMYDMLEKTQDADSVTGGNLHLIVSGGAPLAKEYVKGFLKYGIHVNNGYGMTECSPAVTINHFDSEDDLHADSVGIPLPDISIRIDDIDEFGVGEICINSDVVMLGYYKDQDATDSVLYNGWLHTGDLGFADDDGYVYITGRKKNLIILENGKNVSPEELEGYIIKLPEVSEVRVSEQNSMVIAEIYPDFAYISEQGIDDVYNHILLQIDKINESLCSYKAVADIIILKEPLPKTALKKIKRV